MERNQWGERPGAESVRGRGMERNQWGERPGAESVRGEAQSGISEGRGMEQNQWGENTWSGISGGRGMKRNQWTETHEAESMRGQAWCGISEGRGTTGPGQQNPPETPLVTRRALCVSQPRASAASSGVLPYRHLNLSLRFPLGLMIQHPVFMTGCGYWNSSPQKRSRCLPKLTSFAQIIAGKLV